MPSTTYTVNSLLDGNVGVGNAGTLRYVLNQANANNTGTAASPDLIQFSTFGTANVGSVTGSPLPALTDIAIIDGTTAPGYAGAPLVILDGTAAGAVGNGLTISGGSSTVTGLMIRNFSSDGIRLDSGNNTITANSLGVITGANHGAGLAIVNVGGNTIGGPAAGAGNVISSNGADGILITGLNAANNTVIANFIGTDPTGTQGRGNAASGIHLTAGANHNTIGGTTPVGSIKDAPPPPGKPPDGNVISANGGCGILIDGGAPANTFSGNFIGTDVTGLHALGNALDGVAVLNHSDNNVFQGTTFPNQPFIYLNLVSGNGGNGMRIRDSDNTTVQANAFGIADDNNTALPNRLDGVLIEGTSKNTQFGGVIPLGNIVCGNGKNGVEIADTASGTVCFNTFCGTGAFTLMPIPNAVDGFLITSTGGNNVLETNVISGNGANGVHISGSATGVQVEDNIIGLVTKGDAAMPNGADGVLLDGNTHDNFIGGQQISVIMQNAIAANGGDGIAIVGNSNHNLINQTFVGTDITGTRPFGNAGEGIFVGGTAHNNVIGDLNSVNQNVISANRGQGIQLGGNSTATQIIGNLIGTDRTGHLPLPNRDVGILIGSSNNQIGGTAAGAGNTIAFNQLGILIYGPGTGNSVLGNALFDNPASNLELAFGGNQDQPAPVLTDAILGAPNTVHIAGTLTAAANTSFVIQIFASPSGALAEGRTLLGTITATTAANGTATFTLDTTLPVGAGTVFTATATDPGNNTSEFSNALHAGVFAATPDNGGGPQVNVYDAATGNQLTSFLAYDAGFTGGVRVAVGDVNGDGVPDIIAGPGPGGGPNIRVFDSRTGTTIAGPLGNFMAFDPAFSGGVYVAAGDVNGDGFADVIVGADAGGGPDVVVFSGKDGSELYNFFAYNQNFTGGVRVAAGDVNGNGHADIICGAGPGGGPNVTVFSGATGGMLQSFFAFNPAFTAGIYVAAGDTNGDGHADIIAGAGAGGGPNVAVFNGVNDVLLQNFFALPQAFTGGVRIGSFNAGTTGHAAILTAAGPGGGPQVTAFDGLSLALLDNFFAFDPSFTGGIFVGGA